MEETDVETILQRAREAYPDAKPRIITDNGPQFIAKDFKEFIRIAGMTHVKTSPYYPQSNGKIERWHKTLKGECIRVQVPLVARRRPPARHRLRRPLQQRPPAQRHRLRHPQGQTRRPRQGDLRRHATANWPRPANAASSNARPTHTADRSPAATPRPAIDFAAVRAAVTMAAVLQLLGFQANSSRGAQQRGPCPLHGSTPAPAAASPPTWTSNTFHCFKCGRSGNALDLWAQANRQSLYDAAIDLCQRLQHPTARLLASPPPTEQGRGTRRLRVGYLYNHLSPTRSLYPLLANSTRRFFQIRLNQHSCRRDRRGLSRRDEIPFTG